MGSASEFLLKATAALLHRRWYSPHGVRPDQRHAGYDVTAVHKLLCWIVDEPDLAGLEAFDHVQSQLEFDAVSEAWFKKVCNA